MAETTRSPPTVMSEVELSSASTLRTIIFSLKVACTAAPDVATLTPMAIFTIWLEPWAETERLLPAEMLVRPVTFARTVFTMTLVLLATPTAVPPTEAATEMAHIFVTSCAVMVMSLPAERERLSVVFSL